MHSKQKKDDNDAPYSGYRSLVLPFREPQGNGLPDRKNTIQKFTRPSNIYKFNTTNIKKPIFSRGYHPVTKKELSKLNSYADDLVTVAKFYDQILSTGKIFYVYKKEEAINTIQTRYGKNNFSHLVGFRFDRKNAKQFLNDLSNGQLSQNAILVKNDSSTFEKLAIINRLSDIISSDNRLMDDLTNSNIQSKKLNFNAAIKSPNNSYLLAYRYFEPHILGPVSLINLHNTRKGYSDYSKIPSNQILAVLSETKNKMGGFSIGTLSINHKYLTNSKQILEITGAMQKLVMQDYQRSKEKGINRLPINKHQLRER